MKLLSKKIFLVVTCVISLALLLPLTSFAANNFSSGNSVILSKEETINTDYYAAGGTNILDGTVNGDAYVAGGNVIVNGTVYGDVLAAGGNLSINGKVTGNIRAVGGQVTISGEVDRNVTVAGGTVSIQKPAVISGSLTAASGNMTLTAPVGKGVVLAGGQISINNVIGGDVKASAEQISVMQDAKIEGGLTYWSPNQAHIVPFTIKDKAVYHHTELKNQKVTRPTSTKIASFMAGFSIVWIITSVTMSFLLGIILLHTLPVFLENVTTTIHTKLIPSLGIGFAGMVLLPFAFVVLLITVVGIPFAFLLLFAFILLALFSQIFISLSIGKKLLPQRHEMALLVGLVIYALVTALPVVGWMFNAVSLFVGVGAIIMVKKNLYFSLRTKKLI